MKRWIPWLSVALTIIVLVCPAVLAERYAVLIEGDSAGWFDEFWNDTLLMYEILIDDGFDPANIFVLFNQGLDFASANPRYVPGAGENAHLPSTITTFPADIASVQTVFNGLRNGDPVNGIPQMTSDDFLFVWTFDHGGCDLGGDWNCDPSDPVYLCLINGNMYDSTFASLVNGISYARRVFLMQQCYCGGFIPYLQNNRTVILTAADRTPAYRADDNPTQENEIVGGVTYHHGEFNFHVMNALHWLTPVRAPVTAQDTDGNKAPSMSEAFTWVSTLDTRPETPQYSDLGSLGGVLHISAGDPANATDVFMRDHTHGSGSTPYLRPPDDGSVPSNLHGEALWISPDILVSTSPTGTPVSANPVYGLPNYLYCNVYNFNRDTAGPICVNFYWADPTVGLAWPTDWHFIGTGPLASLAPGGHDITDPSAVVWSPPSPSSNSHYCLLAILNAPNDAASYGVGTTTATSGMVANDNNIVWRNVTVIVFKPGFSGTFVVNLSNPLDEVVEIDVDLIGIPKGWNVSVGLLDPGQLQQAQQDGARRTMTVLMQPGQKRPMAVEIEIPQEARITADVRITIMASAWNRIIGGYTFIVTAPDPGKD